MFNREKDKKSLVVFVSLSYKSLTIAYKEESELIVEGVKFNIQSDMDTLMELWEKGIKKLLAKVSFNPYLVILVNSSLFLVKNIQNIDSENAKYNYVSKQLDIAIDSFQMTHIQNSSYLIVKNSSIEKILFAFKDFNIKALYDSTLINSLYFLKKRDELYINISLNSSTIIYKGSMVQKRVIDKLFLKYLYKSSEKLNLDLESTYNYINSSFSKIGSYQELVTSTQNGAINLREFIDDLVSYIEDTLRYFNNYDSIEYIRTIYLDGDILELSFITNILKERLSLDEIIPINTTLKLNDHKQTASTIAYIVNEEILNSSSIKLEGLRYSDGKQEYIFIDNNLISEKKLSKEQKKKVLKFKRVVEIEEESISTKRRYKKSNKSIWQMNATELFELLKDKLSSNDKTESSSSSEGFLEDNDERGKIIFLIFLIVGGSIYFSWLYIKDLENNFNKNIDKYNKVIQKVDNIKSKLSNKNEILIGSGIDKIIWTEKFITLSKSMPDAIWFSSIRLENIEKKIDGKKVISSRMVLDGRSLPSSNGHIKTIAIYMENLMKSDINFRKDFESISFGGAESIYDELNENLISFQLYCNFRKNINIENIKKEKIDEKKSIAEKKEAIKENKEKKKEIPNNLGKEK